MHRAVPLITPKSKHHPAPNVHSAQAEKTLSGRGGGVGGGGEGEKHKNLVLYHLYLPSGKEPICQAGDVGLISGSGRSFGEGNGNPL